MFVLVLSRSHRTALCRILLSSLRNGLGVKKMAQTNAIPPAPVFDDADDNEVVVTHAEYTGNFISFYNVDPNKVIVTLFDLKFFTTINNFMLIFIFRINVDKSGAAVS